MVSISVTSLNLTFSSHCSTLQSFTNLSSLPVTRSFSLGLKTRASTEPSWNLRDLLIMVKVRHIS